MEIFRFLRELPKCNQKNQDVLRNFQTRLMSCHIVLYVNIHFEFLHTNLKRPVWGRVIKKISSPHRFLDFIILEEYIKSGNLILLLLLLQHAKYVCERDYDVFSQLYSWFIQCCHSLYFVTIALYCVLVSYLLDSYLCDIPNFWYIVSHVWFV